jgi:Ca2+-binding EF-hand superfamily protein
LFLCLQLEYHEFAKVLAEEWQLDVHSETDGQLTRMVFDSFNTNKDVQLNGLVQKQRANMSIDLEEFVTGMARVVTTGVSFRFGLLFSVIDVDGSNSLSEGEVTQLCLNSAKDVTAAQQMATQVVKLIDEDGSGSVTLGEFCSAIDRLPALAMLLDPRAKPSSSSIGGIVAATRSNSAAEPRLTPEVMRSIFESLADGQVEKNEFRELFRVHLGVTDPVASGLLYRAMDDNNSGGLNVREIIKGLSQWSSPDTRTRLAFYFDLFDDDHSGKVISGPMPYPCPVLLVGNGVS